MRRMASGVNAVCPGEIHTPMLAAGLARTGRTVADLDRLVLALAASANLRRWRRSSRSWRRTGPFICGAAGPVTGAQAVA